MKYGKLAMLAAACVALTAPLGCKTTQGVVNKGTEVAANALIPPAQEIELGEQLSTEIEKEVTLHADPEVQKYVADLGQAIVKAAGDRVPEGITFTFKVIDDPETVNAFAMPGGYIYVYSGLLLEASSASEVIGVMGHEVAHVTERHVAERLIAAYGLQAITDMALGKNPGQIAQIAASLASQGYLLKYGREQEREADKVGLSYVLRANYSPDGMVSFFRKLAADGPRVPTFLSSHPDPGKRADRLEELIAERKNVPTRTDEDVHQGLYARFKTAPADPVPEGNPGADETAPAVTE